MCATKWQLLQTTSPTRFARTTLTLLLLAIPPTTLLAATCVPLQGPVPALELSTPVGSMYINILADSDGPVRIPIESPVAEALQITRKIHGEKLVTLFHAVRNEVDIDYLGRWELDLPPQFIKLLGHGADAALPLPGTDLSEIDEASLPTVEMFELSSAGVFDWSMRLTVLQPASASSNVECACCSCGGLFCCPESGHCQGCGDCGDCCCSGPK